MLRCDRPVVCVIGAPGADRRRSSQRLLAHLDVLFSKGNLCRRKPITLIGRDHFYSGLKRMFRNAMREPGYVCNPIKLGAAAVLGKPRLGSLFVNVVTCVPFRKTVYVCPWT